MAKCNLLIGGFVGTPENIWTLKTKEEEVELTKDSPKWDLLYPYFKENKIVEKDKLVCFDKERMEPNWY